DIGAVGDQDLQRVRNHDLRGAHRQPRPTEEVQCPRVTQAAMIAAAMFGSRRSGTLTNGSVGSGLLGRSSEAWPALGPSARMPFPTTSRQLGRMNNAAACLVGPR